MKLEKLKQMGFDPNKDYCSYVPDKWLGIKINDICFLHDEGWNYRGKLVMKFWIDLIFGLRICKRGLWKAIQGLFLIIVGIFYFIGVISTGWIEWMRNPK